jgi:hypothetical protein
MTFGLGTNVLDSEPGAPVASFLTGATVKLVGIFPCCAAISGSGNLDVIGLVGAFCYGVVEGTYRGSHHEGRREQADW